MSADFLMQLGVTLAAVGAIYGGIRADLRGMRESLTRAHGRIDDHLTDHWTRK